MLLARTILLYFCIGFYTSTVGVLVILIGLLVPQAYKAKFILNTWIRVILFFVRHVGGVRYEVIGRERLKNESKAVVISNHESVLETFLYQDLFFPALHVAKSSLKWIPLFGWGLTMIGTVYIDRSRRSEARAQVLEQGEKRINEGNRLVIYPEGTRVPLGEKKSFKTGGAAAAIGFGCKVFPVAHNAGEFWNKKGIIKTGTAKFIIGEPIDSFERTPRDLTDEIEGWIRDTRKTL